MRADDPLVLGLLRQVAGSVLYLTPELVIADATDAYLADTLTKRDDIVGRRLFEVFPDNPDLEGADGEQALGSSLECVLATRSPHVMPVQRYDIPRPPELGGGFETRYWSPQNRPLLDEDGEVVLIAHHVVDVTDQVMSREQEERFALVSQATNDALWDWDLATDALWWSDGIRRLFGYDPAQLAPTIDSWEELIHADDRSWVLADLEQAFARGDDTWSREYRFVHANGHTVWVIDRALVVRDEAGRAVRMVGGMSDITERRVAQDVAADRAALLDLATDAIIVRDLDHRITYWNRGAESLYGWTAADVRGSSIRDLLYDDPAPFDIATAAVLEHGTWMGELRHRARDGREIIVNARWTRLDDGNGRPRAVFVINTDVTERRQVERQNYRAQRLESLGTLAGGIAHDLNNVFAPIMMAVELLAADESDAERLQVLNAVEQSAKRGAGMVRQVLSFARGVDGERKPVSVADLFAGVQQILLDTIPKNITVQFSVPSDLPLLTVDSTQMHQVLVNLCVNARDALPDGGTITLSARALDVDEHYASQVSDASPGRHVAIEVTDDGIGMGPEIQERLFEPFFTTKEHGKGTGLGLPTSLTIVRSHHGFIRVSSAPGAGSTFTVNLPVHAAPDEPMSTPPATPPRGAGELILVVDDEPAVRRITADILVASGYRVITAADGAQAIELVAEQPEVALVITDMMMPVMDGAAAIRGIRVLRPDVPVIAVSGLRTVPPTRQRDDEGIIEMLAKPYSATELLERIAAALATAR